MRSCANAKPNYTKKKLFLIEVCQVTLPKVRALVDSFLHFNLEDLHANRTQVSDARNLGHGPIAFTNEHASQACDATSHLLMRKVARWVLHLVDQI